jgi:hypothetical protein
MMTAVPIGERGSFMSRSSWRIRQHDDGTTENVMRKRVFVNETRLPSYLTAGSREEFE